MSWLEAGHPGRAVRVEVVCELVVDHLLVDQLLPLLHRQVALVHAVVPGTRRRRVHLRLVVPSAANRLIGEVVYNPG